MGGGCLRKGRTSQKNIYIRYKRENARSASSDRFSYGDNERHKTHNFCADTGAEVMVMSLTPPPESGVFPAPMRHGARTHIPGNFIWVLDDCADPELLGVRE